MALQLISGVNAYYLALSTDIDGNGCIAGAARIGAPVFLTDTSVWKYVKPDLTLGDFVEPNATVTLGAALPAGANVIGGVTLQAGEEHVGALGGNTLSLRVTPTISAGAIYAAGDTVGDKITLTNAVRVSGGTGILQDLLVIDKANQKANLEILIFESDPSAATITDNAAFVFSTDIAKLIQRISIASSDYVTINSIAIASMSSIGKVLYANGSRNLYAVIINTGTPTYATTSDLTLVLGILQD
jgi:hypothetical protein